MPIPPFPSASPPPKSLRELPACHLTRFSPQLHSLSLRLSLRFAVVDAKKTPARGGAAMANDQDQRRRIRLPGHARRSMLRSGVLDKERPSRQARSHGGLV